MSNLKIIALGLMIPLGLAVSLPAQAEGRGGFGQIDFSELDADGNGSLSAEELQAGRGNMLERADADGDGQVTETELLAMVTAQAEERVARVMERLDADGDGAITEAEIAAAQEARQEERRARMAERIFERIDENGDGEISAEEFEAAQERMQGRRGGGRGFFGNRG